MNTITVRHVDGDRFSINARHHVVTVDQSVRDGGEDTGPTPTELFVASLAGCVAFYAHRYLARHDLPDQGMTVTADYDLASHPARVAGVRLRISLPRGIPAERERALLAVASHCTVHNTLTDPPDVTIGLDGARAAA